MHTCMHTHTGCYRTLLQGTVTGHGCYRTDGRCCVHVWGDCEQDGGDSVRDEAREGGHSE